MLHAARCMLQRTGEPAGKDAVLAAQARRPVVQAARGWVAGADLSHGEAHHEREKRRNKPSPHCRHRPACEHSRGASIGTRGELSCAKPRRRQHAHHECGLRCGLCGFPHATRTPEPGDAEGACDGREERDDGERHAEVGERIEAALQLLHAEPGVSASGRRDRPSERQASAVRQHVRCGACAAPQQACRHGGVRGMRRATPCARASAACPFATNTCRALPCAAPRAAMRRVGPRAPACTPAGPAAPRRQP